MAGAGFSVTVIGRDWEEGERDSIAVKSIHGASSRLGRMTRTVWKVYEEAKRQDADVYHFHDPELIPIGLLLHAAGKSVIYDIHEDAPKDVMSKPYLPQWSRPWVSRFVDAVERTACGRFTALVVVTPSIAKRFAPINRRTVIVHNYPQVRELLQSGTSVAWQMRRQSVAYVGGISLVRAIREMVHAMSYLPESLAAQLELAGPEAKGETNLSELQSHAGWARVKHHGFIDQRCTFEILQNVRAGLVLFHPEPNHFEALPQKMFEYMGAGLPVIASDFPFWRKILDESGCAIFVDPLNPQQISKAIEYVLTHPREAEAMGRRGQAAVLQNFNWDSEAEKLIQLYRSIHN